MQTQNKNAKSTWGMVRRFLSYYRPHRKLFLADMAAAFFVSAIGMVYPIITNRMLNDYIPNRNIRLLLFSGGAVLILYIVRMLLRYFLQYYGHLVGVGMQAQMRRDLFAHLEQLPYSYYDDHQTGSIMSRLTGDLFEICELAHHGPENLLISLIMVFGSFGYLCTIHAGLTLIIFLCAPILFWVAFHFRRQMDAAFTERRVATAEINAALESSLSGIRVTKAFTNAKKEQEKFEVGNRRFVEASRKAYHAMAKFFSSTSFITDIFNILVLIAGGLFLYQGKISVGDYSTFIVSVNLFISPITTLINFIEQYQDGTTGFRRFVEIMDTPGEQDAPGAVDLTQVRGDIEFQDVFFHYGSEGAGEVLRGVTLRVQVGEMLALVGPSGGGKTTVCHLLPRFYSLTGGRILIDGQDIAGVTLDSLRRCIGIVQQDVFLFDGTVRENILYGRLDASEEEMIAAAKQANIHDYIMTLDQGYDTEIGERGVRLSGGQKQRLSIARVFLKNPAILILDEATSALDNTTEILIQEALDQLCRGRTTIVVAHRLSTIRSADRIAVISEGHVAEEGAHETLMEQGGIYRKLYELQLRS